MRTKIFQNSKFFNLFLFGVLILLQVFGSCTPKDPIATHKYESNPEFTWGLAQFYGSYYNNYDIENNVLSLQLFTEKLYLNADNELDGYGQYLIIKDIFIEQSDTFLLNGTYHANNSGEAFSFFPGKKFKSGHSEISSGAYIYYIEFESFRSKIAYVTDGFFTVNQTDASHYKIDIDFTLDNKNKLTGNFNGDLPHYNLSPKRDK